MRAVAITTLAKLAARVRSLRKSIRILLKRCCSDSDDEVRDRAIFYDTLLARKDETLINDMINHVANDVRRQRE